MSRVYICDSKVSKEMLKGLFNLSDSEVELDNDVMKCSVTRLLNALDDRLDKSDIDSIKKGATAEFGVESCGDLSGDESLMDWYMLTDIEAIQFLEYLSSNAKVSSVAKELREVKEDK